MTPDRFATVVIDPTAALVDKALTYLVPSSLEPLVGVGSYVLVPLRGSQAPGFVIGFSSDAPVEKVKAITQVLHPVQLFDESQLKLAEWIARYYHCSLAEALRCIAPAVVRQRFVASYRLTDEARKGFELTRPEQSHTTREQVIELLARAAGPLVLHEIQKHIPRTSLGSVLESLVRDGLVIKETQPTNRPARKRALKGVRLVEGMEATDPAEAAVVEAVRQSGGEITLQRLKELRLFNAAAKRLMEKGWLAPCTIECPRTPKHLAISESAEHSLTPDQESALEKIVAALEKTAANAGSRTSFAPEESVFVIHGVTASGKTEVYLRAIAHCLRLGRQAIVLVPEISLTEQTLAIFRVTFGEQVAVFHSSLSKGERFDEWLRAREGKARIVLGPRSAVFAPLRNIGLIVIDEEHDASYKQENAPRYHAREVALRRAQLENAVVVLGSATPSMESYQSTERGKYRLITMLRRIGERSLPSVQIVDLRHSPTEGRQLPIISARLAESIATSLDMGQQVILFLNRRGFCPVIYCPSCGHTESCRRCSVSMTFHQQGRHLRCHHCNHTRPAPSVCTHCDAPLVTYLGMGTERVECEVKRLFPEARVLRMDRDTTTRKGSHGFLLESFRKREADILIGTQMIAKGLDFPGVALVGVVLADTSLHLPDFRSAERTFQLLAQVSGRAGRGEFPGRVMLQTYQPEHYAIVAAATQDYARFWQQEAKIRRQLPYPPFTHLANIVVSSPDPVEAERRIREVAEAVRGIAGKKGGTEVVGPAPCPLAKVKDQFRWHLLLRDKSRPRLHETLEQTIDKWSLTQRRGLAVDIDPLSLL